MGTMRDRTREILALPLDRVVASADQEMVKDTTALDKWVVPRPDLKALREWGLPLLEDYHLVSHIHEGGQPEELDDGRKYYSLGTFTNFEVVAASPSGEVWGLPLIDWFPVDYFINSSIAGYIESSWRWYRISQIVYAEDSIERHACLQDFFDFIAMHDPKVASSQKSLWHMILLTV
ncbi:SUKH-4 family immunity protein [Kitasatospora sp. NPDC048286]|uniref:SUKH-4 family immunity protein n=1 Tax=Kitasatospora sp. NPDC048286 TaxID=3364047 RepID=UPI00371399BB